MAKRSAVKGPFLFGSKPKRVPSGVFVFETKIARGVRKRADRVPMQYRAQAAEENLPTEIQGKDVDSKEEARVGVGLEIIGWRYQYKVQFFGGRGTPGGSEVDFLVYTWALRTPLYVQSGYFHIIKRGAQARDRFAQTRLRRVGGLAEAKEIWDYEARTVEQTVRTLLALLGRP